MELSHFSRAGSEDHLPKRLVYLDAPHRAEVPRETNKAIDYKNIEKMTKAELTKLKEDVKAEITGSKTPEDLFNALAERLTGAAETGIQRRETPDGEHVKREAYLGLTPEQQKEVKYYRAKEKGAKIFLHDTVDVLFLQALLHKLDFKGADGKSLAVDGVWGDNTKGAVKAFQEKAGIKVDGEFGPETFMALAQHVSKLPGGVAAEAAPPAAPKAPEAKKLSPEQQATLSFLQASPAYKNYVRVTPEGNVQWKFNEGTFFDVTLEPDNIISIHVVQGETDAMVRIDLDEHPLGSDVNHVLTGVVIDAGIARREASRAGKVEAARSRSDAAFAERVKDGSKPLSEAQKQTVAKLRDVLKDAKVNVSVDDAGALSLKHGIRTYPVKLQADNRITLTVQTNLGSWRLPDLKRQDVQINLNDPAQANGEFIEKTILDTEKALKERFGKKKEKKPASDPPEGFDHSGDFL